MLGNCHSGTVKFCLGVSAGNLEILLLVEASLESKVAYEVNLSARRKTKGRKKLVGSL